MYRDMEEWIRIRQRVLREGVSKRQILRETGMHWATLEKASSIHRQRAIAGPSHPRSSRLTPTWRGSGKFSSKTSTCPRSNVTRPKGSGRFCRLKDLPVAALSSKMLSERLRRPARKYSCRLNILLTQGLTKTCKKFCFIRLMSRRRLQVRALPLSAEKNRLGRGPN